MLLKSCAMPPPASHGLHLLHLDDLPLQQPPFGDVDAGDDDGHDVPGVVPQRGVVPGDRAELSPRRGDPGFQGAGNFPATTSAIAAR